MSFPTGWTSARLTIDHTKVSGTTNLTNFPVLINNVALGTTGVGTAIWSNSQGQEINTNRFLNDANLQGYYKLESDGTDSSPNGYTLTGSSPVYTTARFNNGGDFETSSTHYLSGSTPNCRIGTSQTFSAWCRPESFPSVQGRIVAVSDSSINNYVSLTTINTTNVFSFQVSGLTPLSVSSQAFSTGSWYHVVGRYDSSGSTLAIFVNGVKTQSTVTAGTHTAGTGNLAIARLGDYTATNTNFDGFIDDVAIFNRALTDAEIKEIYRGGADIRITSDSLGSTLLDHEIVTWDATNSKGEIWAKLGTVNATTDTSFYIWYDNGTAITTSNATAVWSNGFQAVYHLDSGGNYAIDSSSNDYTLTAGTSLPIQADGQVGSAVDFESSGSQSISGSAANANIRNSQSWFAWAKFESVSSDQNLVAIRNSGTGGNRAMYLIGANNTYRFDQDGLGTGASVTAPGTISSGSWNFFAGVFNQAGSTMTAYLNSSGTTITAAGTGIAITGNLVLGKNGDRNQYYFDGILDEVYITNDAKSNGWIETYYNNTHSPATFISTAFDFTRAISDNINISDVINRTANYIRFNTNNLSLSDTINKTSNAIRTVADNIVLISEDVKTTAVSVISLVDSITLQDFITRQVDYNRKPEDIINIADIIDRTATYNRILEHNLSLSDILVTNKVFNITILDNISITDSVNIKSVTNQVKDPIIEFYQIEDFKPTIYNITNG